jgi:hypothetical protein
MPRKSGDDKPGKFSGANRRDVNQRENRKFRSDQSSTKHLPTFARTASYFSDLGNEDTLNFLHIMMDIVNDGQYIADGCLLAVKRYHKIGHYDEVIAAQETAFDNQITAFFKVFGNVIPMEMLWDILTNPPTDETNDLAVGDGTTANTTVPLYERDTLVSEYQALERANVLIIPGLFEIIKKMFFVVHEHKPERVGATYSPGSNFMYGCPWDKLSDWQTLTDTLKTTTGKFAKYCNYFGIPLVPFKVDMMTKPYTEFEGWDHPELDVFLDHMPFYLRGDDGGLDDRFIHPTYNYATANYRFIFRERPEETYERHMLTKLLWPRNASYNLYGGGTSRIVATAQDSVNFCRIYEDDDSQGAANGFDPVGLGTDSILPTVWKFSAMWETTAAKLAVSQTGTYLSGDNDLAVPLYHLWKGYKKFGTLANDKLDDIVVEYLADKLNLQNVKKNNFSSVK